MKLTLTFCHPDHFDDNEPDPFEEEMAQANALIEKYPEKFDGYMMRARLHLDEGYYEAAMKYLNKAIKRNKNHAEAYALRGLTYSSYYFDDKKRALREYAKAMKLLSRDYPVRMHRKEGDERIKPDPNVIIEQATSDIRQKKDVYGALIRRARAYGELVELKKMERDLKKAIQLEPSNAEAYIARAELRELDEEDTRVKADVEMAFQLDPMRPEGYVILAKMYYHAAADCDKEAFDAVNKAISIDKKCARAYQYRGLILQARGELKKGLADLRKAMKLDPQYCDGIITLAMCAEEAGLMEEALTAYENFISQEDEANVVNIILAIKATQRIKKIQKTQQENAQ
ncbi:hypothetical protein KKG05_09755 [bacterium]|nr:hypothetical protein [bacterium]